MGEGRGAEGTGTLYHDDDFSVRVEAREAEKYDKMVKEGEMNFLVRSQESRSVPDKEGRSTCPEGSAGGEEERE
ncbi:MAG: hypothetical protein D6679_01220 [Candidatus Hydrogenedentota bacterium]|nr:MAG: hypothetical protein D6679_01220 [Candidatus Hydrogenedentota bacterium]